MNRVGAATLHELKPGVDAARSVLHALRGALLDADGRVGAHVPGSAVAALTRLQIHADLVANLVDARLAHGLAGDAAAIHATAGLFDSVVPFTQNVALCCGIDICLDAVHRARVRSGVSWQTAQALCAAQGIGAQWTPAP